MLMSAPLSSRQTLDRHYLEMRGRLLELAACFDRIERADPDGSLDSDPRLQLLRQAVDMLQESGATRAEQLQLLFSDPYVENWSKKG
jgi:hypothetical protein